MKADKRLAPWTRERRKPYVARMNHLSSLWPVGDTEWGKREGMKSASKSV